MPGQSRRALPSAPCSDAGPRNLRRLSPRRSAPAGGSGAFSTVPPLAELRLLSCCPLFGRHMLMLQRGRYFRRLLLRNGLGIPSRFEEDPLAVLMTRGHLEVRLQPFAHYGCPVSENPCGEQLAALCKHAGVVPGKVGMELGEQVGNDKVSGVLTGVQLFSMEGGPGEVGAGVRPGNGNGPLVDVDAVGPSCPQEIGRYCQDARTGTDVEHGALLQVAAAQRLQRHMGRFVMTAPKGHSR